MGDLDIGTAKASDMENWEKTEMPSLSTDGISDQKETVYTNPIWEKNWGAFLTHPELKTALLMKAVWNVGKGYTADARTTRILDNITGAGGDSFTDILFNMELVRRVGRDSFAAIMRDVESGELINLRTLDPGSMRIIYGPQGMIIRYEQMKKFPKKGVWNWVRNAVGKKDVIPFRPDEIFHLTLNRLADQVHGISDIESLDDTLIAELESFNDMVKISHRQGRPFIVFKLKTDDQTKIDEIISKVNDLREKGEDFWIPDDEDVFSFEVVSTTISPLIMDWRREVLERLYRALGMPLVLFGSTKSTESGGKMEVFAHEQIFQHDQKYIEEQVWNQLALRIDLIPPQSIAPGLATDEKKDLGAEGAPQGLETQPADTTAGVGE